MPGPDQGQVILFFSHCFSRHKLRLLSAFWCSFAIHQAGAGQAAPSVTQPCHANPNQALVAHRGARAHWPDNTLAAYEAAIVAGATALEVDVRMTLDQQLVVMHDPLINRTTNGHGLVQNLRLEQVRALEIITAPEQKVPTLAEVLELAGERVLLMLDLKVDGETYWQALTQLLRHHPHRHQVILGVRTLREARRLKELLPEQQQLALSASKRKVAAFLAAGTDIIRLWPRWLKQRPELAQLIREHDAALYIPTRKNGARRVRRLLCHRPRFIQTDDPQKLTATLKKLSAQDAVAAKPQ